MTRRERTSCWAVVALAVLGGCSLLPTDNQCQDFAQFGLGVRVKDSTTGAWAASGARFEARTGTASDTGSFPAGRPDLDSLAFQAALERAGVYTVTVRKPGYRDWTRAGVRVTEDECHVRPVSLTARLQRVP